MNIVEAYTKYNKQLIILVSGLSGSGRTKLANSIEKDFKLTKISMDNHCVQKNNIVVKLSDGVTVTDWDHIDAYDWLSINNDINTNKKNGCVVVGPYFPTDKIDFTPNFHLHVKITKQKLFEKRHEFIKNNPSKCPDILAILNTPTENLLINQVVYPHYIEYMKKSKVDKYLNANELSEQQIYDNAYDYLINVISKFINDSKKEIDEMLFPSSNEVTRRVSKETRINSKGEKSNKKTSNKKKYVSNDEDLDEIDVNDINDEIKQNDDSSD